MSGVHPADLLATVLRALVQRNDLDPALVDDIIAGCVGQSGDQAMNIARTATLVAGFPESVPATTLDRQCGSSQQPARFAAQGVIAGAYDIVIAGGVESMSSMPMFSSIQGGDPLGPLAARYPNLPDPMPAELGPTWRTTALRAERIAVITGLMRSNGCRANPEACLRA